MRSKVYFVRLIEQKERESGLMEMNIQSIEDSGFVTRYLVDKDIAAIYSSPYNRSYETLVKLSQIKEVPIISVDDFREHFTGDVGQYETKKNFLKKQWEDFNLKTEYGESLGESQKRCINAVKRTVSDNQGKDIVIGTHGIALALIVNYYYPNFSYDDCLRNLEKMPFIAAFRFDALKCTTIDAVDLFAM